MLWYLRMGNEIIYEDMYGKGTTRNSVPVPEIFRITVQYVNFKMIHNFIVFIDISGLNTLTK